MIRARKECPEIGWGEFTSSHQRAAVLAIRYDWRDTSLVTLHNFADRRRPCTSTSAPTTAACCATISTTITAERASQEGARSTLGPYMHKWYRVGGPDTTLKRAYYLGPGGWAWGLESGSGLVHGVGVG